MRKQLTKYAQIALLTLAGKLAGAVGRAASEDIDLRDSVLLPALQVLLQFLACRPDALR